MRIEAPSYETDLSVTSPKGLSDIAFDELMDKLRPGLSRDIRAFISSLEEFGVYPELLGSLNLKAEVGREKPVNLGYIQKNGRLWTDATGWKMPPEPTLRYVERMAELIGGKVANMGGGGSPYVVLGKGAPLIDAMLPQSAEGWRLAIRKLLDDLRQSD